MTRPCGTDARTYAYIFYMKNSQGSPISDLRHCDGNKGKQSNRQEGLRTTRFALAPRQYAANEEEFLMLLSLNSHARNGSITT